MSKANLNILEYAKLEYYVSQPRLERFLRACDNSRSKAQDLYRINLQVSQAFYPILNLFEIFLRNSINHHISSHFDNADWIINEKNGFMAHPSLSYSRFYLKKCVQNAERIILEKGGAVTSGKIIAEQSLGFWTSLFVSHHFKLIGGTVLHCFSQKPAKVNRSIIDQKLSRIRKFRNRVYHNEPICFDKENIDFKSAILIKKEIYDLFIWMDNDLKEYADSFDVIDIQIDSLK